MIPIPRDLILALAVMLLLSAALVWAGAQVARRWGLLWSTLMALGAVGVLIAHGLWLSDSLLIAKVLPVSDVIVLGNLSAPAVGFLCGFAWVRMNGPRWNKAILIIPLAGVGVWRLMEPFVGDKPHIGPEKWTLGVCRQTTLATCSDAAAVTLLHEHSIRSTEGEMSNLCLTRTAGTTMLGLYRGLKLKTRGTVWDVRVFQGSMDDFRKQPLPAVITVGAGDLPQGPGWLASGILNGELLPEGRHSVVVIRFDGDEVEIGDPFVGRQRWMIRDLEDAWRGEAIMLTK